jgi:hypothetical protein
VVGSGTGPVGQNTPRTGDALDPVPQPEAPAGTQAQTPTAPDPNELTPNAPADPNELKPNVAQDNLPAPPQVNQIDPKAQQNAAASGPKNDGNEEADVQYSSSKHNKKKGLRKVVPF